MDIVADLNSQGIECLKDERIYDGLENFAQALVICEQLLSSVEQENEQKKKNGCFVLSHTKVAPWILTPADLSVDLEEQGNFTYCKAMRLQTRGPNDCCENPLLFNSFACVFNLALGHHLYGLMKSSTTSLRNALQLYEHAYTILRDDTDIFISIVVVNNIGRIHHHLGNSMKARQCSEYLLAALMRATDERISNGQGLGGEDKVLLIESCFSNVVHLVLRDGHTSPAA
jgi:tetratricopeptide (TPR) repeat protein